MSIAHSLLASEERSEVAASGILVLAISPTEVEPPLQLVLLANTVID